MVTLVLDRNNLELRIDGDALAVYQSGEPHGSIPLVVLERVVLHGTIRLDTNVLLRLAEAGVPTVVLVARNSCNVAALFGPIVDRPP